MLLHTKGSSVELSEGFATSSFTIVDSQNSFALLQGKQYENAINATLRALVENAMDAHTQVGSTEKVVLDINHEGVQVRDHGPGISPDDFQNHFTKFFASNRTGSNDYHGFFGVGAKAPLSVANKFRVHTVHAGMEYIWECARGNPAPVATLNYAQPAEPGAVGTTTCIDRSQWLNQFYSVNEWFQQAVNLAQLMPDHLHLEGYPNLEDATPLQKPVLYIGGMPYPCPDSEALGIPSECMEGLNANWSVQERVRTTDKKQFGRKKKVSDPARYVEKYMTRTENLKVPFAIGEVELHFSKEKVALTPGNINTIKSRVMQSWLDWQLELATFFSTGEKEQMRWRMPASAAKELKAQGHSPALLAWATRPLAVSGSLVQLQDPNAPLSIAIRRHEQGPLASRKWFALMDDTDELNQIKNWADEWGITVQLVPTASKFNARKLNSMNSSYNLHKLPNYNCVVQDMTGIAPVVVTVDDAWYALDASNPKLKSYIQKWLDHNDSRNVYLSSLSLSEVQQHIPNAVGIKDHCKQLLDKMLQRIPDDALGMKTVCLQGDGSYVPAWASTFWKGKATPSPTFSDREGIAMFGALHAWVGLASPQYIGIVDWVKQQESKIPLLAALPYDIAKDDYTHLLELVNQP